MSHAAAVLPFVRTGLVPSALVIGSMVPDAPYFVPTGISSASTHAAAGIVSVDVVLGLLVFLVWHQWLAPAAVALAPHAVRDRLAPELPVPLRRHLGSVKAVLLVLVSLALGAATHVLWDAFAHDGRWGTDHIAWLRAEHGPLRGYTWVQYAGGALGLAALFLYLASWWMRTPPRPGRQRVPALGRRAAITGAAVIAACFLVGAAAGLAVEARDSTLWRAAFRSVTWGGGAAVGGALLVAAGLTPRLRSATP
ncbi:DUF4184 family protein [Solirubrobacter phytolaccae]|uniref:DUF4184 family protein n=1 Tax=Solirubrobacter phytolaccae TaxID=1404360 RepID=A0A9X3NHM5_9ACTN|nr:DUF4184 family protein [Solirubrobacter phytolaccae]MDA0185085.1 DUF4184 family protein [Solirubrobacter phytolaccae]